MGSCCPKDAIWITLENSLRCEEPEEVYQLLKASDRVTLGLQSSHTLFLRKWEEDLDSSMEFRCFVRERSLVAACQRDDTVFYQHLWAHQNVLFQRMEAFIQKIILPRIPSCSDLVVDLYLDPTREKIIIIDFGPWDERDTDGILFSWRELESMPTIKGDDARPPLRLIESEAACRLGRLRQNCLPVDLAAVATMGAS